MMVMYTLMSFLHGHCAWHGQGLLETFKRKEIDRKEKKIEDLERLEWNACSDFIKPNEQVWKIYAKEAANLCSKILFAGDIWA